MKMHKYVNIFLGFSVIAGFLGKSVSKNKKILSSNISTQQSLSPFVGTWSSQEINKTLWFLKITQEGKIYINDHLITGKLTSITNQQLVFTDHFGYELIAKRNADNSLSFYDEADEKNYLFVLSE